MQSVTKRLLISFVYLFHPLVLLFDLCVHCSFVSLQNSLSLLLAIILLVSCHLFVCYVPAVLVFSLLIFVLIFSLESTPYHLIHTRTRPFLILFLYFYTTSLYYPYISYFCTFVLSDY